MVGAEHEDKVAMLRNVAFLRPLGEEELARLARRLIGRTFTRDSVIVRADDPGTSMFFIFTGSAKVVLSGGRGREVILATLAPGDFFGEMSIVDGQPRSATVVALEETQVFVLTRESLLDLIRGRPEIALALLAQLSMRLRKADSTIAGLAFVDVSGRVARYLVDEARANGRPVDGGIALRNRPTQQHIASVVGATRETVSRILSEFKKRGLVRVRGREIVVTPDLCDELPGHPPGSA